MNKLKYSLMVLALTLGAACGKMDSDYYKFIKNGPIIYPGKADSVTAYPGHDRVMLSFWLSDPAVTSCKIFWNFGEDSTILSIGKVTSVPDTITTVLDSLPEGSYSFTVYTYDQAGNKSVPSTEIGNVYGSIYSSTLVNRPVRTLKIDTVNSTVQVVWVGADINCLGTQWQYTGVDGTSTSFYSPIGDTTLLTSVNVLDPITFRSLYVPEIKAIDTFYTDYAPLKN